MALFFLLLLILVTIVLGFVAVERHYEVKKLAQSTKAIQEDVVIQNRRSDEFCLEVEKLNAALAGVQPDPLTGLPGCVALEDRIEQAIKQCKRFEKTFAVMFLDIDHFAELNQKYSYEGGDEILKEVARRSRFSIRQVDSVTRYGGNKFLFLLPQLSMPATAVYVAQRLLEQMILPFSVHEQEVLLTASVGIAIYPNDGLDRATLLKNAESALDRAKTEGGNRYQFYREELHELGQRELAIRTAITSDDVCDKLVVYYQPHINVKTGEIVCLQAKLYLQLEDFGLINFVDFSHIAENYGKIFVVGEWYLRTALKQFQEWRLANLAPHRMEISVTLKQIENAEFLTTAQNILKELKTNPLEIVFEIDDHKVTSNNSGALYKAFMLMNQLGVQTSVGVFALGHLALQKITKLHINYLVIDEKLIQNVIDHEKDQAILDMMISLAKNMNIGIVADGVDGLQHKLLLQTLGCEVMKGELFGHPQPAEMFWLKNVG